MFSLDVITSSERHPMFSSRLARGPLYTAIALVLLAGASYAVAAFVPGLAVAGIVLTDYTDMAALAFSGLGLIMLAVALFTGHRRDEIANPDRDPEPAAQVLYNGAATEDLYDLDSLDDEVFDDADDFDVPPVRLTKDEKKALKAAEKADKARQKQEAKFQAQAQKEAAKADKLARKGKGPEFTEILSEDRGTGWARSYDDPEPTPAPVEVETPDWLTSAYDDPDFVVPFTDVDDQFDIPEIDEEPASVDEPVDYDLPDEDEQAPAAEPQAPADSDATAALLNEIAALRDRIVVLESRAAEQAQTAEVVAKLQHLHTLRGMVKETMPDMVATLDRIIIMAVDELPEKDNPAATGAH